MANIYVRSTDGDNGDNGSTWALAKATLVGADGIDVAGDTIYVSQSHAESTAAAVSLSFAGTNADPIKIICGNDAAEPPTSVSATGAVATTGASSLSVNGAIYVRGLSLTCGNGFNFASLQLNTKSTNQNSQFYESCDLILADTHPSSNMSIGPASAGESARTSLLDCRFKISSASQTINLNARVRVNGGSFISGTSTPSNGLFSLGSSSRDAFHQIENLDFSNLGTGLILLNAPASAPASRQAHIVFRNCKFAAGWTLDAAHMVSGTLSAANWRVEAYNCDAGDTNYRVYVQDYTGITTDDVVRVKTGGASDGTTPISWKMVSNANCNEYVGQMTSPEIMVWNDTSGASKTVTVDILHDSVTNMTDAEVWLEVQEGGTSGSALGVRKADQRTDCLASPADQTASAATWTTTSLTNPNKQKLAVTFTPAKKGPFICRVVMGKTSKTIYVDPVAQVS
jgi:hypothetical protein